MEVTREVVKPSVWNLLERKIAPLWVNDDREAVVLAKIQREEAEERKEAKATPRYQIGNMRDVCQTLVSQHSEPKLDYAPQPHKSKTEEDQQLDTGLKKLIFVEMEEYPGFIGTPSPLPQKIETLAILKIVTSAIKITEKPGLMREWRVFFFSQESKDIVHDIFWWFFLKKFQKPPQESPNFVYERELREKTSQLFERVATTYTMLLNTTFKLVNREKLLLHYPNAVAQAIYSSYCHAFPVSWRRYETEFKHDVLETINLWMTGTKPMIRHWLHWDYNKLEPPNMRKDSIDKDANNQKQKAGDKSSVDNLLVIPSTSSGGKISPTVGVRSVVGDKPFDKQSEKHFDKQSEKHFDKQSHRGVDNSHTSLASSHLSKLVGDNEPSRKNLSVYSSMSPPGRVNSPARNRLINAHTLPRLKGKQNTESHPAEPGPDFVLTKFDSSGHSPLVEHCLRQQKLARDVGVSKLISRKEISSYPSLNGPTYKQLISESRKRVKTMTQDVNKYWDSCRRVHVRKTNENQAQRLEYQQKSARLMENPSVVGKLAELIVNERIHNAQGSESKITATIDALIALQDENDEKQQ